MFHGIVEVRSIPSKHWISVPSPICVSIWRCVFHVLVNAQNHTVDSGITQALITFSGRVCVPETLPAADGQSRARSVQLYLFSTTNLKGLLDAEERQGSKSGHQSNLATQSKPKIQVESKDRGHCREHTQGTGKDRGEHIDLKARHEVKHDTGNNSIKCQITIFFFTAFKDLYMVVALLQTQPPAAPNPKTSKHWWTET